MNEVYRIESRINTLHLNSGKMDFGQWSNWSKKYKSLSALLDAWKVYRDRKWYGSWGRTKNGKYIKEAETHWEFRPIHFYEENDLD